MILYTYFKMHKLSYYQIIGILVLTATTLAQTDSLQIQGGSKPPPKYPKNIDLEILTHIQTMGDVRGVDKEWVGTRGQSLRLEGFSITPTPSRPIGMRYYAHLQGLGDTDVVSEGNFVGTRGQSLRLEGFAIYLTDGYQRIYNVFYQAHLEGIGDTGLYSNGQFCGTRDQSRSVQAIKVWIKKK